VISTYAPRDARNLFGQASRPWWVAGGWAIDLFLGQVTRDHEDLDVAILRKEELVFRSFLADWDRRTSVGEGRLDAVPLRTGAPVPSDREVIWCRPSSESGWAFELLLSRTEGDDWLFKRNPAIRRRVDELGSATPDGVPFLRPEVALLFKAKAMRARDRDDFEGVVGELAPEARRRWLRDALVATHPSHEWIGRLHT
jgi:Aminoglycoside-2''-adenylyltransferase